MKIGVLILDRYKTWLAAYYENQVIPYGTRAVIINLTPEQERQLERRELGSISGEPIYEEYGQIWIQDENQENAEK